MNKWQHLKSIAHRYGRARRSSLSFWYLPVSAWSGWEPDRLVGYAVDFQYKTRYNRLDSNGVPVIDYGGDVGVQYNGCAIAQYALGWHQLWLSAGDAKSRQRFLDQADWLVANQIRPHSRIGGLWPLAFDLPAYGLNGPWISALIQSQAVSVLLRAEALTGKHDYGLAADAGIKCFFTPVSEGGVSAFQADGVVFEEAPTRRLSCVLDGFMYSLLGIHEYALLRKSGQALKLREKALDWLAAHIHRFDLGFWSRADLYQPWPPCPASQFYHQVHVYLLEALYHLRPEASFRHYARRWSRFADNPVCRMLATASKVAFKLCFY